MNSRHSRIAVALTVAAALAAASLGTGCSKATRTQRAITRADKFRNEKQLDRAEIEYLSALKLSPGSGRAIASLGLLYYDMGATTLSIPYLVKGRELMPDALEVRTRYAMFLSATGDRKRAAEELNYVLAKKPRHPEAPALLVDTATTPAELRAIGEQLRALPDGAADGAPVITALGVVALREGRLQDGEALLRKAIAIDAKFDLAHVPLVAIELARGNRAAAEEHSRLVSSLCPEFSPRRTQYAQFLLQSGRVAEARKELEKIVAASPSFLSAKMTLAAALASERQFDEAIKNISAVVSRDPANPDALLLRARIQQLKSDFPSAAKDLERLLGNFPNHTQAAYQLAMVQLSQGETNKAMGTLMRVLALKPDFTDAAILLAEQYVRQGNAAEGLLLVTDVVKRRPNSFGARLLMAEIYRLQGRGDDARATLLALEKDQPNEPQIPLLRGNLELQLKNRAAARAAFEVAYRKSNQGVQALEQLTLVDIGENRSAEAIARIQDLLNAGRKEPEVYVLLGRAHWAMQNRNGAEEAFRNAIRVSPESRAAYFLLARLYSETKETDKALENLRLVVEKNPKDTAALLLTGILLEQKKDFEGAKTAYEKLLLADPKFGPALNNLAYLYSEKFNRVADAQALADRARAASPNDAFAADTLGWILYRQGKYAWALGLVKEAAERLPFSGEVHYHLGLIHYAMGEETAAKAALEKALSLEAEFNGRDDAAARLAVLSQSTGPEAIASMEKVLAERPDDTITQVRLAAAYAAQGSLDKAARTYESLLAGSPSNLRALRGLAEVRLAQKDYTKASETAKAGRKIAADDADLARVLGLAAWATGDRRYALSMLQEATRRLTDDGDLFATLGDAAYSFGRVPEATAAWTQAVAKAKTPAVRKAAEDALVLVENRPGAETLARAALKANPQSVPALMALARSTKAPSEARGHWEAALAVYPEFFPAMRELVVAFAEAPGDEAKLAEWAAKAREALPADRDLARAYGFLAARRGDYARAATLLSEVAPASQDPRLHFTLGRAQSQVKGLNPKPALERALALGLTGAEAEEARKLLK